MQRRLTLVLGLLLVAGCAETYNTSTPRSGSGRAMNPDEGGSFYIDMQDTNRFVEGYGSTAVVEGRVISDHSVQQLTVAGSPTRITPAGADATFSQEVMVGPGAQTIPIIATDSEGTQRKGHRSVISADFLPEGNMNPRATYLAVTQSLADAMAADLTSAVPEIDVAREIMSRGTLSSDDTCTTRATGVTHGATEVVLVVRDTGLYVQVRIPNLRIDFDGNCSMPLGGSMFRVTGRMQGTPVVEAPIFGEAEEDSCLVGLQTEGVRTTVEGWDFNFTPHGLGLFEGLLVGIFGGGMGDDARDQLAGEINAVADPLLREELSDIEIFDSVETISLFGRDAMVELCTTYLGVRGGQVMAGVGARVTGAGGEEAPGAPMLRGEVPDASGNVMLLDSQLVTQLLFSAWRSGGLDQELSQGTYTLLKLAQESQDDTPVASDAELIAVTTAELPAVTRAAPITDGSGGDLRIVIPDMRLDLRAEGLTLLNLMSTITMDLELVPNEAGELVPTPVEDGVSAEVHVIGEPLIDYKDELIETFVGGQIGTAAAALLEGATIGLPSVGGAIFPTDVQPDVGGRYLVITLR